MKKVILYLAMLLIPLSGFASSSDDRVLDYYIVEVINDPNLNLDRLKVCLRESGRAGGKATIACTDNDLANQTQKYFIPSVDEESAIVKNAARISILLENGQKLSDSEVEAALNLSLERALNEVLDYFERFGQKGKSHRLHYLLSSLVDWVIPEVNADPWWVAALRAWASRFGSSRVTAAVIECGANAEKAAIGAGRGATAGVTVREVAIGAGESSQVLTRVCGATLETAQAAVRAQPGQTAVVTVRYTISRSH